MATGTQDELGELGALARLVRGKARQAYRVADELRALAARLEDAVAKLDTERDTSDERARQVA